MTGRALIEARDISKAFVIPAARTTTVREHAFNLFRASPSERLQVLDRVSLELRQGDTLGIMGRNGSGKSTLLKVLAGIFPADTGTVRRSAAVTPVLELGLGWNPELDAVDNVFLLGSVLGLSLHEIRQGLEEMLAFAELERFAGLQLKYYSSGMASRLAYAVAFHAVREVLILDEIFAVGDAGFRAKCEERYRALAAAGHSIIIVSHDIRIVEQFCSRAVLLDAGRVVANGTPADITRRYLTLAGAPAPSH
ncbi:MAG: ABC transporter ATP-binding protein [Vicinamibacterales bacterium]